MEPYIQKNTELRKQSSKSFEKDFFQLMSNSVFAEPIEKMIRPKAGFTAAKYKYRGPYNPLDKQLSYNPETGEVLEWNVQPYNKVDELTAYQEICKCDYEMVKSLDEIP